MMSRRFKGPLVVVLFLSILLAPGLAAPQGNVQAQAATDMVVEIVVPDGVLLPMRSSASLSATVIRNWGNGNRLAWNGQITLGDGRNWMFVSAMGVSGWMSPDDQQMYLADPSRITLDIDRGTTVTPAANPMTLYAQPGRGQATLGQLAVGTQLRVTDGPVITDLYTWWPVQVVSTGASGWVVDTGRELQVLSALRVYGYQVCSNFDLKRWGVVGWDSVRSTFSAVIPANEQIQCLASTNMRGDNAPIVVVLSRNNDPGGFYDVLRIFEQQGSGWRIVYQQASNLFSRTERLSLHDLAGDGRPMLMWNWRNDGTGDVLIVNVLRYTPGAGITPVLTTEAYKGSMMFAVPGSMIVYQANYLPNEPNCCPSGIERNVYSWNGVNFGLTLADVLPAPGALQTRR